MRRLAFCAALALAAPASSYTTFTTAAGTPLRWPTDTFPVPYFINERGSADVPFDQTRAAIEASFNTWQEVASASISFRLAGVTAQDTLGGDGVNLVRWFESGWPFDATLVGLTMVLHDTTTGSIVDADMALNGSFPFSISGEPDRADMQSIVTHEAGHFLGLNHTPIVEATMFPAVDAGETIKRDLHADDIEGVSFLYPLGGPPPAPSRGDVDSSGLVDGRDLVLFALAFGAPAGEPRYLAAADFNSDGVIDGLDLSVISQNFGSRL